MAAKDPLARTAAASIASNVRWSMVPNRQEATAAARRNSPTSIEFWRAWAAETHPGMSPADQLKAADNGHRAHMKRMARKAAVKRAQQGGGKKRSSAA